MIRAWALTRDRVIATDSRSQSEARRRRRIWAWRGLVGALPIIVFAVSLYQNLAMVERTPFHPDETRWLNRAHYLRDFIDPSSPTWQDGYLTRGQAPLGSYVTALGLLLQGRDLATNGVWDFHYGFELDTWWNVSRGNMPDREDLIAGRRASAMIGAVTAAAIYFVVKGLSNPVGGLAGGLIFALHPLQTFHASRVLADPLLLLIMALAALAAMSLKRRPSWPRALLLGVLLGLGASAKLSPIFVALLVGSWGVLILLLCWARGRWQGLARHHLTSSLTLKLGVMLLSVPVVAAATFVASYPYLWPSPLVRSYRLFEFRAEEMGNQARVFPAVAVDDPVEAFRRVWSTLHSRGQTDISFICSRWSGCPQEFDVTGFDLLLALGGLAVLLAMIWREGLAGRHALCALVLGGQAGMVILGMRSDFARYHLPVLLFVAVLVGLCAGYLAQLARDGAALLGWPSNRPQDIAGDAGTLEQRFRRSAPRQEDARAT